MCIKSGFKEIILKLATNGQSDKELSVDINICPQGVVCPCLGLYTCGNIKNGKKSDFKEIFF